MMDDVFISGEMCFMGIGDDILYILKMYTEHVDGNSTTCSNRKILKSS